jgi:hypothetical protein
MTTLACMAFRLWQGMRLVCQRQFDVEEILGWALPRQCTHSFNACLFGFLRLWGVLVLVLGFDLVLGVTSFLCGNWRATTIGRRGRRKR